MKFKMSHTFQAPLANVQEARQARYKYLERFPELKETKEIERREDGKMLYVTRQMAFTSHLPPMLRGKVSDDLLDCLEYSEIDQETNIHKFKIVSPKNEKIFSFRGESKYFEEEQNGETVTVRDLRAICTVNVPFIGGSIEEFIVKQYKKGVEKDIKTIETMLKDGLDAID